MKQLLYILTLNFFLVINNSFLYSEQKNSKNEVPGLNVLSTSKNGEVIKLPEANITGKMSVEETISRRRSIREFSDKELSIEQISQLLWSLQGITNKQRNLRSAPSAGATYPLEVYTVTNHGVFKYIPQYHQLKKLSDKNIRPDLSSACLGQRWIIHTVNFVITAVFERTTGRYGDRGKQYVYIEVGHAAENLHLQAVALGLGSVPVGAFNNNDVAKVLSLPKNEVPIYVIPVGYPK